MRRSEVALRERGQEHKLLTLQLKDVLRHIDVMDTNRTVNKPKKRVDYLDIRCRNLEMKIQVLRSKDKTVARRLTRAELFLDHKTRLRLIGTMPLFQYKKRIESPYSLFLVPSDESGIKKLLIVPNGASDEFLFTVKFMDKFTEGTRQTEVSNLKTP